MTDNSRASGLAYWFCVFLIATVVRIKPGHCISCDDYAHVTSYIGRRYAHQISRHSDGDSDENLVIDKNIYTCTQTKCHSKIAPWWRLDMRAIVNVSKITIYPKMDDIKNLNNFDVLVAMDSPPVAWEGGSMVVDFSDYKLCNSITEPMNPNDFSMTIACKPHPIPGRFIGIRKHLDPTVNCTYLSMCEIDIWKTDQLIVSVVPSERQLIAGRPVIFSCMTEPLECKNFYYFWSFGRQWLTFTAKILRFTANKEMSGTSLYCFVKNRENIELGHDSFSLSVINYPPNYSTRNPKCWWNRKVIDYGRKAILVCLIGDANPPVTFKFEYNRSIFPRGSVKKRKKKFEVKNVSGKKVMGIFVVRSTNREMNGQNITLTVYHPLAKDHKVTVKTPTISFPPDKLNTTMDYNITDRESTFFCYVGECDPKPIVKWRLLRPPNAIDFQFTTKSTPVTYRKIVYGHSAVTSFYMAAAGLRVNGYRVQCVIEQAALQEPLILTHVIRVKSAPNTDHITFTTNTTNYGEEDKLLFICDIPDCYPPPKVRWLAPGSLIRASRKYRPERIIFQSNYVYRAELQLLKVSRTWNRRSVTCEISQSMLSDVVRSDPITIDVQFPPVKEDIVLKMPDKLVEYKTAIFVCEVPEASPAADIQWELMQNETLRANAEGTEVVNKRTDGAFGGMTIRSEFFMKPVSRKFYGFTLQCRVQHPRLSQLFTVSDVLNITYAPVEEEIRIEAHPKYLISGKPAKFFCISPISSPPAVLNWIIPQSKVRRAMRPMNETLRFVGGKRYMISAFQLPKLRAEWSQTLLKCTVMHELLPDGMVVRGKVLVVSFPPERYRMQFNKPLEKNENSSVSFLCSSPESEPPANVTWELKTRTSRIVNLVRPLAQMTSTKSPGNFGAFSTAGNLVVPSIPRTWDKATLMCIIFHPLMPKPWMKKHKLSVRYVFDPSEVKLTEDENGVLENSTAVFRCHVPDASPPPSVEWIISDTLKTFKNSTSSHVMSDKTIHSIKFVLLPREMNGELVSCAVKLDDWDRPSIKSRRVLIKFPPYDPRPTLHGSSVFAAGERAKFTCDGALAAPPVQLTWEFRNPEGQRDSAGRLFKTVPHMKPGMYRTNVSVSHLIFPTIPSSMNEFTVICRLRHIMLEKAFTQEKKVFVRFGPDPERFGHVQIPEFVQPGQPVSFVCNIPEASPRANISWIFPDEWKESTIFEEEVRPGIHKGLTFNGYLKLKTTKLTWHQKEVTCLMKYNSSEPLKRSVSLSMKFKPLSNNSVVTAPKPVNEGFNATFRCISPEAKPSAIIVWEIFDVEGMPVNFRGEQAWITKNSNRKGKFGGFIADSNLTFLATKPQMNGFQVSCRIDHELLKRSLFSKKIALTVRYSFTPEQLRFGVKPDTISENDNVTFTCGVPPASPPANVTWILAPALKKLVLDEKIKILEPVTNYVLRLGPMNRQLHNLLVVCRVNHLLWNSSIERNTSIEMTFTPQAQKPNLTSGGVFAVGSNAMYWCTGAEGLPVGEITWELLDREDRRKSIKGNSKIKLETFPGKFGGVLPKSHLTLFSVTPSMNGLRLLCHFKHKGLREKQSAETRIHVKFGPDAGQLALLQKPMFAHPSGELVFECYVPEASPKANITWIVPEELQAFSTINETVRQGKMFGEAVTGFLWLTSAHVSWNGKNITCVALHDNGPTIQKSALLQMNFGPLGPGPTVTPSGPVTEGSDVTFRCLATEALPPATIVWQLFDRDGLLVSLDPTTKFIIRNKTGRYGGFQTDGKMILPTVSASMNGYYVNCRIDHDLKDSVTSNNMEVIVRFAPRDKSVILKQNPPMVSMHEDAKFICEAPEASPQAEVKWILPDNIKPHSNIKTTTRNGTQNGFIVVSELTIQNVLSAWNGVKVTCVANYGSRTNTFDHTVHLKMRFLPKSFLPTLSGPEGILQPGTDVDFDCSTPESNPPAIITWILADHDNIRQPLPTNTRQSVQRIPGKKGGFFTNSRITFLDIQSNYSGFSLTCEARQYPDSSTEVRKTYINLQRGPSPTHFVLEQHPKYGRPEGNVEFVCYVPYSVPRATIRWTYPPELIPKAKISTAVRTQTRYGESFVSRLRLSNVHPLWRDKTFRCVIHHNLTGEMERSIRLTLTDVKALVRIDLDPSSGVVSEGSLITTTCYVTSCIPDCSIVWVAKLASKQERFLKTDILRSRRREEVFSQIRITMKPAFEGATIQCRLKGSNTSLETSPFTISGAPRVKLRLASNQLLEGSLASFECDSAIRTPNIYRCELGRSHVVLSRRDGPGEFSLRKITRHDAGRYWCRCENYLGSSTDQARLDVKIASKNLTLSQTVVEVKENNSVKVVCKNDEAFPPAEIYWESLNKTELNFTTKREELPRSYRAYQTITEVKLRVNRYDNGAILNCVAKSPADSSILAKSVIIRVLYPPEVKIVPSVQYPPEGTNNFSLECISKSGNPRDYYFRWASSEGGLLSQNKTVLPFPQLMRNQSAIYKCIVSTIKDFEVSKDYEVQVAYMDINLDPVIQLRTGDNIPNVILNITAFPAPESFEWLSDGHPIFLEHKVLSSKRDFHQVALQLNAINHSLASAQNHSLRIKHLVGHRVIKVVLRDGRNEDGIGPGALGIPWMIIAIVIAFILLLFLMALILVIWRKKTRFRKKLIINGGVMDYSGKGVTDMFSDGQDNKGVLVVRGAPYTSSETSI